jgi:Fe-S-cluster containining protein
MTLKSADRSDHPIAVESLPVVTDAASRACLSCHGPCCYEHNVSVSAADLRRLARGLAVPWQSLADIDHHPIGLFEGFRLDRGARHYYFLLKRRESGACLLLVEIDDRHRRCGVHALRPMPCRRYPLVDSDGPDGAELGAHAICPPEQAAIYRAGIGELRALVDEPQAERALYKRVLERWDQLARITPADAPLTPDDFYTWVCRVYDVIDALRTPERGDWQPDAYLRVDAFPLPGLD